MKRNHKHAALIQQWLDDDSLEVETEFPSESGWKPIKNPDWHENRNYRFKPKMIKCGDMEFPAPARIVSSSKYYPVSVTANGCTIVAGNHTTKEAAEAHARALISLTEVQL